jgi:multiple sugar transport system ATP-binding protein
MAEVRLNQVSKSYDGKAHAVRQLDLLCREGEMLALLGPSGCGKSSTLKMVAGIETVSAGSILFDGVDMTHRDSAGRNVAMVFEDYSLYPHLSVFENIAFPLRVRGVPTPEVERKVSEVVSLLGLSALLQQRVRSLSGGAQQRVSIGRALVRDPAVVMFDEPLSHLDADQKVMLRTEIRRLQTTTGLTSVLVTHDQTEAMAMADQIAVMNHGVLQQVGSPRSLYDAPANRFVAGFIGDTPMNFFDAEFDGPSRVRLLGAIDDAGEPAAFVSNFDHAAGVSLSLGIRPEDIEITSFDRELPSVCLRGSVLHRECGGDRDVLLVQSESLRFHVELAAPSRVRAGDVLNCHLPIHRLHAFDASSGESLGARRSAC